MAIIITIMVLDVKVPHGDTLNDLRPLLPDLRLDVRGGGPFGQRCAVCAVLVSHQGIKLVQQLSAGIYCHVDGCGGGGATMPGPGKW